MTSAITVNGLAAKAGFGQITLSWQVNDPFDPSDVRSLDAVEVYSSLVPDWNARDLRDDQSRSRFVDKGLPEDVTFYYWIRARDRSGDFGEWFPLATQAGVSVRSLGTAGGVFPLVGGNLVATLRGGALTVAVKTLAGNDPSQGDAAFAGFRSPTIGTGTYEIVPILSPLSFTLANGSTMGVPNSTPFRLWCSIFNDAGILRLGLKNCYMLPLKWIAPLPPFGIWKAGGQIGSTADSPGQMYAAVDIIDKPMRVAGYLEWTSGLATAGNWNVVPDVIQLLGPGIPGPGGIIANGSQFDLNVFSGTSTIPFDDTIPQSSEGGTVMSPTANPISPCNIMDVEFSCNVSSTVVSTIIGSLFRDNETSARAAAWTQVSEADGVSQLVLKYRELAGASSMSYVLNVGGTAGRWTISGVNNARKLGGVVPLIGRITELMG